jgi:hypothetical protein
MDYGISALPFAAGLFGGMVISMEIGRRLGLRALGRDPQLMFTHSAVDSAVFALFGLLLAFTLSGAPARLDSRRQLIAQEANAIGTAYLRLELLAPETQSPMREQFRNYLDSRLDVYRRLPDVESAKAELSRSGMLQTRIWFQAVAASRLPASHPDAGRLLLPALNDMFDITTTRSMAIRLHPPLMIFLLLFLLALVCSLLAGYGMAVSKQRSWLHILAFASISVITVFVILEIEYPRMGLLSLEGRYDQVLVDLRNSME